MPFVSEREPLRYTGLQSFDALQLLQYFVMLAAISFGKILFGMALVVAFSLGLAFVLSAIGIALVAGRTASRRGTISDALRRPVFARIITLMPILSAVGVMVAGFYITYQAWNTPL